MMLSRSSSKAKVIGQSSRAHEENTAKVVDATSSEGFLVSGSSTDLNRRCGTGTSRSLSSPLAVTVMSLSASIVTSSGNGHNFIGETSRRSRGRRIPRDWTAAGRRAPLDALYATSTRVTFGGASGSRSGRVVDVSGTEHSRRR